MLAQLPGYAYIFCDIIQPHPSLASEEYQNMSKRSSKKLPPNLLAWVILLAAAAAFYFFFARAPHLYCQRSQAGTVDCTIQERVLGQLVVSRRSVNNVTGASVATQCKNADCRYRLELNTGQGKVPFVEDFTPQAELKIEMADNINAFLADTQQPALRQSVRLEPLVIFLPLAVLALFGIYKLWPRLRVTKKRK